MDNEKVEWCEELNKCSSISGRMAFQYNKDPICPHCGNICEINDCELWYLYEEGDHEVNCPDCGFDFMVCSQASWRFSTDEQE